MKLIILLVSILIFVNGAFGCTVNISNVKATFLSGHVVDQQGNPIPEVKVGIYKNSEYNDLIAETIADDTGRFHINGVVPGKYRLRAGGDNIWKYTYATLKYSRPSQNTAQTEIVIALVSPADCSGWAEVKKLARK